MYLPPVLLVAAVASACALPVQDLAGAEKVAAGHNTSANCAPITVDELLRVLGGAYNGRYMAVEQPPSLQSGRPDRSRPNGTALAGDDADGELQEDAEGFAVPADHLALLGDSAAWLRQPDQRTHAAQPKATAASALPALHPARQGAPLRRRARHQPAFNPTPWACEGRVLWSDLGADYFPRFLRSVECAERRCWYDRFECRPRAFAVKVLRRVPGKCAPEPPPVARPAAGVAHLGLAPATPPSRAAPAELWLWEERAVAFCCECASVEQ